MPTFLYKGAIRDLRGADLLPLNMIRDRYPDLYDREAAKYSARPHVMDHPVYPLGCRWIDVLFFSPVHPEPIFAALREAGRAVSGLNYWTIDASLLSPDRTCILLKRHDPLFRSQPAEDYIPFTPEAAAALAEPSPQALHRLRNLNATEHLLPWADIPHILHRGPLPVSLFRTPDGGPVVENRRISDGIVWVISDLRGPAADPSEIALHLRINAENRPYVRYNSLRCYLQHRLYTNLPGDERQLDFTYAGSPTGGPAACPLVRPAW